MLARELMTPDPSHVTPDDPISVAAELMRDLDVGMMPVVENRNEKRLIGVITDRDIAVRCVAGRHAPGCRVRDHMSSRPVYSIDPDADVSNVLATMKGERVRRVPVVSDRGTLLGIIAQADLATRLGPERPLDVEKVLERVSEPAHAHG